MTTTGVPAGIDGVSGVPALSGNRTVKISPGLSITCNAEHEKGGGAARVLHSVEEAPYTRGGSLRKGARTRFQLEQ